MPDRFVSMPRPSNRTKDTLARLREIADDEPVQITVRVDSIEVVALKPTGDDAREHEILAARVFNMLKARDRKELVRQLGYQSSSFNPSRPQGVRVNITADGITLTDHADRD